MFFIPVEIGKIYPERSHKKECGCFSHHELRKTNLEKQSVVRT
jgi:hypothetical protein